MALKSYTHGTCQAAPAPRLRSLLVHIGNSLPRYTTAARPPASCLSVHLRDLCALVILSCSCASFRAFSRLTLGGLAAAAASMRRRSTPASSKMTLGMTPCTPQLPSTSCVMPKSTPCVMIVSDSAWLMLYVAIMNLRVWVYALN